MVPLDSLPPVNAIAGLAELSITTEAIGLLQLLVLQSTAQPPRAAVGGVVLGYVISVILTVIVAGLVLALGGDSTTKAVEWIKREPVECFVYGVLATIAVIGAAVLLAITVVGLLIAIPGLIVFAFVSIAAYGLAVIALGTVLLSTGVSDWRGILVAALVIGVVGLIPVIGGLFNFVLSSLGLGVMVRMYLDDGSGTDNALGTGPTDPGDGPGFEQAGDSDGTGPASGSRSSTDSSGSTGPNRPPPRY